MTRAQKAGDKLADAIIEMIHLMYQDNTALKFTSALSGKLSKELKRRKMEKKLYEEQITDGSDGRP